ncbi:MAG: amino acid adenylation domain-containing protein, partial [Clostridia bacterium]|nr:amino acid adenylation domain-containing protein [Clostridia bacterium]
MNLTKPQKLIYDMEKFTGGSVSVLCGCMLVCAKNSAEEMKKAVNALYRLNDALRIRAAEKNGQPYQWIAEYEEQEIEVLSFDCKEELDEYASAFAKEPFDFYGSLCDLKIIILPDKRGILVKLHHLISDAWTISLIGTQFNKILNNEEPQAYSYVDYINAEEKYIESKRYVKDKEYFISQFKKCDEMTFVSEKQDHTFESRRTSFVIEKETFSKILAFANEKGVSVLSLFLSAVAVYVNRTSSNVEHFYIGTTVLNRSGAKEQNTMGMFVNTAPILIELDNERSFAENLTIIDSSVISVLRHQKYNYGTLLEELRENQNFNQKLYDVIVNYQNAKILGNEVETTWYHGGMQVESLQINIDDRDCDGIFRIHYDYRIDKFCNEEIIDLHKHIFKLLFEALENPHKKIADLEILSAEEKQKVLVEFNDTAVAYPRDKCVHELFEEQVAKNPDKTAVVAVDKTLTYKELNEEANRIAHSLMEKGVGRGDIVGLMLPRKSSFLSALFGILKTGAAYLPIDPDQPEDRVEYMLATSSAKLCITEENIAQLATNEQTKNPARQTQSADLCYCIYTSGSTGVPKGTLIGHCNLVWYVSSLESIYGKQNINMPLFTSQSVDLTVTSVFFPLLTGGTVYPCNGELLQNLADIFSNKEITLLKLTPTHIDIICQHIPAAQCSNLRYLIVGGEQLYAKSCTDFLNKFGHHIEIHNEYGPTETTVGCMDYIFDPKTTDSTVSVGHPNNNVQLYITDKYMNPVPIGVTGEICIAGDGVGAGYLNRPALTAEKFIDNPFGEGKLYRTGDLAYWREDGNIVFVGRNDFQV